MGIDFRGIGRRLRRRLGLFLLGHGYITLSANRQAPAFESLEQEGETLFFAAVGQTLSFWASVEELLVLITSMLLGTQSTKAGIIMYSIINFNVKLNIINELFSLEPDYRTLEPKWNKINERLRALKDTIDRLAHHTIFSEDRINASILDTSLKPVRLDIRQKSQKYQPLDFAKINTVLIFGSSSISRSFHINRRHDGHSARDIATKIF